MITTVLAVIFLVVGLFYLLPNLLEVIGGGASARNLFQIGLGSFLLILAVVFKFSSKIASAQMRRFRDRADRGETGI